LPSQAKPSQAKPSQAKPSQDKTSRVKPKHVKDKGEMINEYSRKIKLYAGNRKPHIQFTCGHG